MRSTTATRSLVLGTVLAGALTLGAVQLASGDSGSSNGQAAGANPGTSQAADGGDRASARTIKERGIVLEGTGTWRGQPVRVFVNENHRFGNTLQIVVGDPDGEHAIAAGEGRDPYVIDDVLNVGLEVDGDLAVVKGAVVESGKPRPVTEPAPDGDLVASNGTRTPLTVTATFSYRGTTVDLRFTRAFAFDLESERSTD